MLKLERAKIAPKATVDKVMAKLGQGFKNAGQGVKNAAAGETAAGATTAGATEAGLLARTGGKLAKLGRMEWGC